MYCISSSTEISIDGIQIYASIYILFSYPSSLVSRVITIIVA